MGDSVFGGSESESPILLEPRWQTRMRRRLATTAEPGATQRIERAGEAYPGQLVAGAAPLQTEALEGLQRYLQMAMPTETPLYGAARGELMSTLQGEYDPGESAFYKAYRTNVLRELKEAKTRMAGRAAARGTFYGGGRLAEEGKLEERAMGSFQEALGRLTETERGRRFAAAPEALRFLAFEEAAPMGRFRAGMAGGEFERMLEQAELQAAYQEWIRQREEMGIPLDVATGMSTYQPPYYQPTYGPNSLADFIASLFGAAGEAGSFGNLFGGGAIPGAAGAAGPAAPALFG